jgi:hypothetical protein
MIWVTLCGVFTALIGAGTVASVMPQSTGGGDAGIGFHMDMNSLSQASGFDHTTPAGVTATVFGQSVPLFRYASEPGYSVSCSGTVTITPSKYWTYGGLYDETTGEVAA